MEYFTFKKVKKHREEKAAKEKGKETSEEGKDKKVASEADSDKKPAESNTNPEISTTSPSPIIISAPPPPKDDLEDDEISVEGTPILDREDEKFLERLTSPDSGIDVDAEDEHPPPLPPRVKTPVIEIESDTDSVASAKEEEAADKKDTKSKSESKGKGKDKDKGKGKGKEKESAKQPGDKPKRFSFVTNLSRNISLRRKPQSTSPGTTTTGLEPDHLAVPSTSEAAQESNEMARVLDDLDLSAKNNRAFSLSAESADMARRFTQVLKDLVNGVPTAYGDLVALLDDRDGVLARNFEKLPSGLKKLVAQLPEKLTGSLAPELLAAAAEAQGLRAAEEGAGKEGLKDAAMSFLTPGNLKEIVTKPGALVGLLKGIVNALKTRFPAFVGTNVLWSLAVFLLMSMLWYCYKRGREVRLEQEAAEAEAAAKAENGDGNGDDNGDETIEGKPRVEELPDDPMLAPAATAPVASSSTATAASPTPVEATAARVTTS